MTALAPSISEPTTPYPPRFRWLIRLLLSGVLVAASLLCLRWWWGREARQLLDTEIDAAHARGELATMADFNAVDALPDDENAAKLLIAAANGISYNPAQQNFDDRFDTDVALADADRALLSGMVTANTKSLQLAQQAAALRRADWGVRLKSPLLSVLLPHMNKQGRWRI